VSPPWGFVLSGLVRLEPVLCHQGQGRLCRRRGRAGRVPTSAGSDHGDLRVR